MSEMSNALKTEIFKKSLIIRFTRPQIRNPLSVFVLNDLIGIIENAEQNKSIERIIFTGEEEVFASGADLREIAEITGESAREFALRGQNLMNRIADTNSIAAINGFCFGGALDLALACRRRIASINAEFCHPGANLGIITGWGGTQRLPRLIGEAKALEMFLTAKRVKASEALQIGLIDEIAENPLEFALRIFRA